MILIIGAGLSGLLTGYRLKQAGIPFKILEARNRIGGRINTLYKLNNAPIEMGATWFTHQHQNLIALLHELEIEYFEQFMNNTAFYQSSPTSSATIIQIPHQSPSYRISGGTSYLINTLYEKLDKNDVLLNQSVKDIRIHHNSVEVIANEVFEGTKVVLAIPPKLWSKKIIFTPNLPIDLLSIAKQTHTWMEDSIKVALNYKQPFWEHENLPSTLFSNSGPIIELYDHCNHEKSKYALCGFLNSSNKNLSSSERKEIVLKQLKPLFGKKVEEFVAYTDCIWSEEEHTFEPSDDFLFPHQNNGNPIYSNPLFDVRLLISSSETALKFPGYMDGAVYSGNAAAQKIINKL